MIIGPRSTRQSNPEEHASQYFNTFSKDMLVQVRFQKIGYKVVLWLHNLSKNQTNKPKTGKQRACARARLCVCMIFSYAHFILLIPCFHTPSLIAICIFFMFTLLLPVDSPLKTTPCVSQRLLHLHTLCNLPCHTPNCQCSPGK